MLLFQSTRQRLRNRILFNGLCPPVAPLRSSISDTTLWRICQALYGTSSRFDRKLVTKTVKMVEMAVRSLIFHAVLPDDSPMHIVLMFTIMCEIRCTSTYVSNTRWFLVVINWHPRPEWLHSATIVACEALRSPCIVDVGSRYKCVHHFSITLHILCVTIVQLNLIVSC